MSVETLTPGNREDERHTLDCLGERRQPRVRLIPQPNGRIRVFVASYGRWADATDTVGRLIASGRVSRALSLTRAGWVQLRGAR